jgi:hypothetical protein
MLSPLECDEDAPASDPRLRPETLPDEGEPLVAEEDVVPTVEPELSPVAPEAKRLGLEFEFELGTCA